MRVEDLDYPLDESLVATHPVTPRDAARMLVYRRGDGSIAHARIRDLPSFLAAGDGLVVNRTRVIAARLRGRRASGGKIEGLLVAPRPELGPLGWSALLRNAASCRTGERIALASPAGAGPDEAWLEILGRDADAYLVRLGAPPERIGWTPLPPYILRARRDDGDADRPETDARDRDDYQTVFAAGVPRLGGSVAAPTAGLHLTSELRARLADAGVREIEVELEVGLGTFRPVEAERLEDHPMHRERCAIPAASRSALARLLAERDRGAARIVAVGTTSVRTLESMPEERDAGPGDLAWSTDLLIAPGYRFRRVDGLLTNFHLPRSTLLALVAGLVGLDALREIYGVARRERYRHYSFGDACLILP